MVEEKLMKEICKHEATYEGVEDVLHMFANKLARTPLL